jgi:hypothetical protein
MVANKGLGLKVSGLQIEGCIADTRNMTLKNAAVLALVGMTLLSVLVIAGFVRNVVAVMSDAIPVMAVLSSLVHAFAAVTVAMFFYFFQRAQR